MDSGLSIAAFSCCSFGSVPCNGTCADLPSSVSCSPGQLPPKKQFIIQ